MKRHLPRWWQPSLVRRLVIAQMITAGLLWVALAFYVARDIAMGSSASDLAQMRKGAAMILPLAEALDTQPELLRRTIESADAFQRASILPEEATTTTLQLPRLYLWRDGRLVYRSADAQDELRVERVGVLFEVSVDGQAWRAYAEDSADGRTRFAAMAPATPQAAGLTPWSRGWLLLPLLVSLPLLVIPAWLSVRFALRPLARLSSEIAARGADDLSALQSAPKHSELEPLRAAVNQLFSRLQQARLRERSFIADAAHELRTPIAAMQVHAEILQQRQTDAENREPLEGLLKSNARAGHLVAQLLALTRSDTAPAQRGSAAVDIEALVQESLAALAPVAHARGIQLDLESPGRSTVQGDAEALRTLIDNLVVNAIKYAPPDSSVRVRMHRELGALQVLVTDEGPGVAPELRERVFDRFYRVPGQTQSGSGLGLAIAKTVADRHGAKLELTDGPNCKGLAVALRFTALG